MPCRTASYDKSYVGSSAEELKSDNLRKRRRKYTPAEGQFLASAQMCGLSPKQAHELMACELEVARAIVAHPEAEAAIRAEADRALTAAVVAARGRRAA